MNILNILIKNIKEIFLKLMIKNLIIGINKKIRKWNKKTQQKWNKMFLKLAKKKLFKTSTSWRRNN